MFCSRISAKAHEITGESVRAKFGCNAEQDIINALNKIEKQSLEDFP